MKIRNIYATTALASLLTQSSVYAQPHFHPSHHLDNHSNTCPSSSIRPMNAVTNISGAIQQSETDHSSAYTPVSQPAQRPSASGSLYSGWLSESYREHSCCLSRITRAFQSRRVLFRRAPYRGASTHFR